jgi:hypothetical protein
MAGITSAVITGVAAVGGAVQTGKANREQKRASKVRQRTAELQNARRRRQNIQAAQIQRAATIAQAANQGVSGGSSALGASGSVLTQGASGIGAINQNESADRSIFNFNRRANDARTLGATFQAVGSVSSQFASFSTPTTSSTGNPAA